MDNIKILHPKEGVTIAAVKVPDMEEFGAEIRGRSNRNSLLSFYGNADAIELPEGPWQILGLSDQLSEKQWRELIEWADELDLEWPRKPTNIDVEFKLYKDYTDNDYYLDTATESGLSFLEESGMTDPVLILKKMD